MEKGDDDDVLSSEADIVLVLPRIAVMVEERRSTQERLLLLLLADGAVEGRSWREIMTVSAMMMASASTIPGIIFCSSTFTGH